MSKLRIVVALWCLVGMVSVPAPNLLRSAAAVGEVGRPPLPEGIERLPFDGPHAITQVPGCGFHDRNVWDSREGQELNGRAFDFGLYQEPVVAAGDGEVIRTYEDEAGALVLVMDHGNGVRSYYVHLQEFMANTGDDVRVGDTIAISGNTGFGAEYHLHFAVTINNDDDPESIGDAANINSLPGLSWNLDSLNDDGFVSPCRPDGSEADVAVGGAASGSSDDGNSPEEPENAAGGYDPEAAVEAARANLYQEDRFANDSAWFVSQALWAGGLPMTDEWNDSVAARPTDPDILIPPIDPSSREFPAVWPNALVNYLVDSGQASGTRLDWSDNNAQDAELGDVIAYDWEGDGIIDHVAIVTNINDDGFPEVSEHSPTYENRYWTYSETAVAFIEEAFPDSVAYLIDL